MDADPHDEHAQRRQRRKLASVHIGDCVVRVAVAAEGTVAAAVVRPSGRPRVTLDTSGPTPTATVSEAP